MDMKTAVCLLVFLPASGLVSITVSSLNHNIFKTDNLATEILTSTNKKVYNNASGSAVLWANVSMLTYKDDANMCSLWSAS